jgi:hypothetical protein
MLEDLVELAAGVEFSEPLEPMGGSILSTKARKRAYEDKEPEEKENFGLSMVVDAEEEADIKFTVNQEVSLNKKIEVPLWGGAVEELASGTRGVIETVYDDIGNDYLFRSEDGITVRVNKDDLKKRGQVKKDEKVFSLDDPGLIYVGDYSKKIPVGTYPKKPIQAYLCPSDGNGTPEVIEIVGARDSNSDYDGGVADYLDLSDGRHVSSTYVFPINSDPVFLAFEDDYGVFHNWAAFK